MNTACLLLGMCFLSAALQIFPLPAAAFRKFSTFGLVDASPALLSNQPADKEREIQAAHAKGIDFLRRIQRTDGAISDTINPLFDTWETVLAATALYETTADTNHPMLKRALTYLRLHENKDGLICHNQKCQPAYCLETTAIYFLLLCQIGEKEKVREKSTIILALQQPTGEWMVGNPDVRGQKDFPSVTAFALTLLQALDLKPLYHEEAFQWLLSKQTPEGDWGTAWEYYGCPAYALLPVLRALKDHPSPAVHLAKRKALQYIDAQQNRDGSWNFKDPARDKTPSGELQTALMLSAIADMDYEKKEEHMNKAIDFLLAHQQANGSWDGGYFPIDSKTYEKKEYVFATAQVMMALQAYLQHQKTRK